MRRQAAKILFVALALVALYAATLGIVQPTDAAPGMDTSKIEPALLKAMQANPKGKFAVIVQTAMPDLKITPAPKDQPNPKAPLDQKDKKLPSIQDIRNAQGVFDKKQALKTLSAQRSKWATERIRAFAGQKLNSLAIIGGAAATLDYNAIASLSRDPFVSKIHLDRKIAPLGTPGELSLYTQIVHATEAWAQGYNGQGIAVAVIDSGVAPVDDLNVPASRIVASVDFTDAPASGDPGGHGTHVAGIVAGNGTDSAQSRMGMAPGANIVNVRVIDANGSATMSSVIRGIEWAVNNRNTYNIRVLNLSLGATTTSGYKDDPLAAAVELAWHSGIAVVTAAGNGLNVPGSIVTPGLDPYVITVGALDDKGTLSTADDTIAPFSSFGPTLDSLSKPDLVAPGRQIVSLRVIGSYLDNLLPDRVVDTNYFRLSGTSMSAPVVSGSAALMLQKNPSLKPDQIKYILTHTTQPVPLSPGANVTGAGLLNAYAAVNSSFNQEANQGLRPSDGFCKAVYPLLNGMPLSALWKDANYQGINWANITWDNITWDNITWDASAVPTYNQSGTWETERTLN